VQKQQSCGGSFAGTFLKALLSLPDDHTNMTCMAVSGGAQSFFQLLPQGKRESTAW